MNIWGKSILLSTLLISAFLLLPGSAKAANDGDLVQAPGDSKVYMIEGSLKRHIANFDTFSNWGFNVGLIRRISQAELNTHPTGPKMTRLIHWGGRVFLIENGQKRYVPTADSLALYGVTFASLTDVNTSTFDRLPEGSMLEAPHTVRVPGDNRVFFLEDGVRRPFANDEVMWAWGYSREGTTVAAAATAFPVGPTLTAVVVNEGNVYAVENGKRRHVISDSALLTNGYRWEDVVNILNSTKDTLPEDNPIRPHAVIRTPGYSQIWLMDGDTRRHIPNDEIFEAWGFVDSQVVTVPNDVAFKYPEGSEMTRYVITSDNSRFYIINGKHRRVTNAVLQERVFGISPSDLKQIDDIGFHHTGDGGELQNGLVTFEGHNIPIEKGKTAREQHLYTNKEEADLGRTDAGAQRHYDRSNTPVAGRNGMAGGYGAFGSEASPASLDQERYYITMRWNYCEWYEDSGNLDSFGRAGTYCRNLDSAAKSWHRHKKVIVTNPSNGKQVVVSVEESGPAIWTGRVSGLSPEAMIALNASTNDELLYYWAGNQDINLGVLN